MTTPVKPIESHSASTQRFLEEFRLDYNTALASMPRMWAESLGDVLSGPSLKDTYPIALSVQKYRELGGQEAAQAIDIKVKDVTVVKREFATAAEADIRRLKRGDFAYIRQWQRRAEEMARGRVFLRNHLVADLIETGESATCVLDGVNFFSASHKVNPFKSSIKYQGSATWSNFQNAATPLSANALTAEKLAMMQVPGPDGEELGLEATHLVVPTALYETAFNLLKVQDLILSGSLDGAGGGTMGTVRNPHFNRAGLELVRAPELDGSPGANSDWYLVSATAMSMGLFPWVLSEDSSEELTEWDESSDYAKQHKRIKLESRILTEAAFLFPHAIRKISGA